MADDKRRSKAKSHAKTRRKPLAVRRVTRSAAPVKPKEDASAKPTPPKPLTLAQMLKGRTADAKVLRTLFLNSGLRYQTAALAPHLEEAKPIPLPDTIIVRAGQSLHVRYDLEIVVAELELNWLPDVDRNGEWDGVTELDRTEVESTVEGAIPDIPPGWSLLQWIFTPANLEKWRALLTIEIDGEVRVFEEVSGLESATHHGHLLIEAKVDA